MRVLIFITLMFLLFFSTLLTGVSNIAPLSSLKQTHPGYVDGIRKPIGSGCGGGGGPCLNYYNNDRLTIAFRDIYNISKVVLYVGCNDGERMDGEINAFVSGRRVTLVTFRSKGCGDSIYFTETATDKIVILMTGGGGNDRNISVQEIEVYGSNISTLRNIAPYSSLKSQHPGYVDGIIKPTGSGCGGGGGPCLNYYNNDRLTMTFRNMYKISKVVLYVGCNDGERMDGEINAFVSGRRVTLATFRSKGCGDSISFSETTTDKIVILMTGGGGGDKNISIQEIECYGR